MLGGFSLGLRAEDGSGRREIRFRRSRVEDSRGGALA